MVGNINIAQDITKIIDIQVVDKSAPLRTLLIKLVNDLRVLEERIKVLEDGN